MKKSSAIAIGVMALFAAGNLQAATQADFEKSQADAKAATAEARSLGFEWRDTGKMLKKAASAAAKGEFDTAIKLANTAKAQSDAAVAQAHTQAKQWRNSVPK